LKCFRVAHSVSFDIRRRKAENPCFSQKALALPLAAETASSIRFWAGVSDYRFTGSRSRLAGTIRVEFRSKQGDG